MQQPQPISEMLARLRRIMVSTHFDRSTETELQAGLEQALSREGIEFERERVLTKAERVDFFLPAEGLAIEVKMFGSTAAVTQQLWRYAKCPEVLELMLVTTRSQLRQIASELLGKPVHVVYLPPF